MLGLWLWRMRREARAGFLVLARRRATAVAWAAGIFGVVFIITGLTVAMLWMLQQPTWVALQHRLLLALLSVFFLGLGILIIGSHGLLCWGHLFRGAAAVRHAAAPISHRQRWAGALLEAAGLCVLTTTVLAGPLIICLSWVAVERLGFLVAGAMAVAAFVGLGCAVGGLGALLLARLVPILRRLGGWLAAAIIVLLLVCLAPLLDRVPANPGDAGWLREVIGRLGFAEMEALPSRWAALTVMAAMAGEWRAYAWHLGLMLSTTLMVLVVGETLATYRLQALWDGLSQGERRRLPSSKPWPSLSILARFMSPNTVLLACRHVRLARRDPVQLLQVGVFSLLIAGYLLLLPRFGGLILAEERFRPAIALLNMLAISMVLAVHAARFVFPTPSSEGRRIWLLAMAPISPACQWWAINLAAWVISLPLALFLASLSGVVLQQSPLTFALQILSTLCIALGLGAGAAGLGAVLADPNEDDAARLAAGPAGTVHLAVALAWVLLVIGLVAIPTFFPSTWNHLGASLGLITLTILWIKLWSHHGIRATALIAYRLVR